MQLQLRPRDLVWISLDDVVDLQRMIIKPPEGVERMSVCVASSTKPASRERERDGGDVTEHPRAVESPAVIGPERRPNWLQNSLPSRSRR